MTPVAGIFFALHLTASLVLAAYGYHRLSLAIRYVRRVRPLRRTAPDPPEDLPSVTVQIPLYNERYVAARVVTAAGSLDYPRSLLEIQVLDDSSDETPLRVARAVKELRGRGIRVHHVRRSNREGFKAGALAHGLTLARGDLVAVFDADFVPPPDFLLRLVGEFNDPSVGMVQARWEHINRSSSLLTEVQALQLDAHFRVEHGVRAATGCFFNFNGTAGIWRRSAIEAAGGWKADTLTEDVDLSYRAQMAGWRFIYRDDVTAPAEVPVEVAAYRMQQQRWAQGGVETSLKLLPRLLTSSLTARVKREAVWHLTGHFTYPAFVILALAGVSAAWLGEPLYRDRLFLVDGLLLTFATVSLAFFYSLPMQARWPNDWWKRLGLIPAIMVLGAGIAVGQTFAVARGLARHRTPFWRTPKYRHVGTGDESWLSAAYRISGSGTALLEFLAGISILGCGVTAVVLGILLPPGSMFLLGVGFLMTGGSTLAQQPRPKIWRKAHTPSLRISDTVPLRDNCA
ncbi:MAG: glycosyltransferase [Gemmatimonadales bacterium]